MKKLPADPAKENERRSQLAAIALSAFKEDEFEDCETTLCDLLADLLHWCDRHDADFDRCLARARRHYTEETTPEEGKGL